jgi:hypothetical protein
LSVYHSLSPFLRESTERGTLKQTIIVALALVCAALAGCDDDPKRPRVTRIDPNYKDLTEKWHVLHNLRQSYNDRKLPEFEKLLDADNFTFFFYEGDVGTGGVPEQWGFTEERTATQNMFSGDGGIKDDPILSIKLFLFDIETVEWREFDPGDDFPGETLYQTIVVYDFRIDTTNDTSYITEGSPTSVFTVREVEGKWKLVQWRDRSSESRVASSPTSTEEKNWSKLKALYQ